MLPPAIHAPAKTEGPNKLWITLTWALVGHILGQEGVGLGVVVVSMNWGKRRRKSHAPNRAGHVTLRQAGRWATGGTVDDINLHDLLRTILP